MIIGDRLRFLPMEKNLSQGDMEKRSGPRERKVTLSFAKIGFWKLLGVGIVLDLAHFALQSRWPELSPHYLGPRPVWMTVLMVSEYCFVLATLIAASETVYNIYTQHRKSGHPVLIVVAYAAYVSLYMWVFR
jgi:hypothetical protein